MTGLGDPKKFRSTASSAYRTDTSFYLCGHVVVLRVQVVICIFNCVKLPYILIGK